MSILRRFSRSVGLGNEKLSYFIVEKLSDDIEIRRYLPLKCLVASVYSEAHHIAYHSNNLFLKLYAYINGNNISNKKIPMTVPVLYDLISLTKQSIHETTPVQIQMKFYLPERQFESFPKPLDTNLSLKESKECIAACNKFGGYAKLDDYLKKRNELSDKLGDQVTKYDCVNVTFAAYDAPFKPIFRTNEVWLKKLI